MEEEPKTSYEDDNTLMQLRQMNSLLYYKPSQASLFSERQQKIQPFLNQSVSPGSTAQVLVNCDEFVYGPTSYLKVQLTVQNTPDGTNVMPGRPLAAIWGTNGTILNIFSGIRLYHRSGVVLEEVPLYAGQLMNIKRWFLYNEAERRQLDACLNQDYIITYPPTPNGNTSVSFNITAMIPMSIIFGVFNNHNEVIPPQLLSGAKIEFVLNPIGQIIGQNPNTSSPAGTGTMNIANINFNLLLDTVRVYDVVKKALAEEVTDSRMSGIQFTYETNYQTTTNITFPTSSTSTTAFSFDINQANSVLKNVFAVFMANNDIVPSSTGSPPVIQYASKNNFYNVVNNLQCRLGSHYMPSQPMVLVPWAQASAGTNGVVASVGANYPDSQQAYENTLTCFDSQSKQFSSYVNTNTVDIPHYMLFYNNAPDASPPVYDQGNLSVYGFLLDRAPQGLALSGPPTNSSRVLNINGQITGSPLFGGTPGTAGLILAFTTSARVCNLIGDSCIVDR